MDHKVGEGNFMRTVSTLLLIATFSCALAAENLEKAQKKALESQAKMLIEEAKTLEKSGQLAEARAKCAESQAMIETNDAANAIKHLDEEIHKRAKDALNNARKLYEARKFKEAAAVLDDNLKLGAYPAVFSQNLAICYFQLGERDKAVEYLDQAITGTADPKQKQRLEQMLTSFSTGEDGASVGAGDRNRVLMADQLVEKIGIEASLEDELGEEPPEDSFASDAPASAMAQPASLTTVTRASDDSRTNLGHPSSLCSELNELKGILANSAAANYNRANCAESNGRPKEAVQLLQKYLELSPNALDAAEVRARISQLDALLALPAPNGAEVRRLYASAYGYLGLRRYHRAVAAFNQAKDLAPDFALTYWNLALIHEAMGDIAAARTELIRFQELTSDADGKDQAGLRLSTLDAKKEKYDEEVGEAEDILADLFNRGMNLTFNLDDSRSHIRARRAQVKNKKDRAKARFVVGGFAVPYPYAQQELLRASEHLNIALAMFPLGAEANELMGLVFLQANDGHSATKSFDAVASQNLPVSFYAEMRGHKLDHAVKCELTHDRVRLIFLSSYDKKGASIAPDKDAGDDGLGDLTLTPTDQRKEPDSLNLSLDDIKKVETNKGLIFVRMKKDGFTLAPIYLPSFTPVEGPPARRFANNYTRLFIRYPGLEDSKLGAEGMTGGEKFKMGYKIATSGLDLATNLNPFGALQATMDTISIARTIHAAVASLSVSFASWERNVDDQRRLLAGPTFRAIPAEPVNLAFQQETK
jgi:tetratricopeptide (TPR) repeat protein